MSEKGILRTSIVIVVLALLSLYLANFFASLYVPSRQLFLDTDRLNEGKVMAFVYDEAPVELLPAGENEYTGEIRSSGEQKQLAVTIKEGVPLSCAVDGEEKQIQAVSRYTSSMYYVGTYCISLGGNETKRLPIAAALFFLLFGLFVLAFRENLRSKSGFKAFVYSSHAVRAIGRKPILLSFLVSAVSLFIFYGCDLIVISDSIILWQKGIDIFQLFACINPYKNVELYLWQYEGMMLAGYGLPSYLLYPTLPWFQPGAYHWLQSFLYKMLNMLLMNGTVLSLISFLLERGLLKEERAREVYYFSVFNPLCFWIAIIFIQFDMLPVYCTLLGILLLSDVQKNKWSAALFLGFGVACKVTYLMLLPSMAFLMLTLFVRDRKTRKDWLLLVLASGFCSLSSCCCRASCIHRCT